MQNSRCKLVKRAIALFAFCLLQLALLPAPSRAQGADEALEAGFAALEKNDGDRAATAFRRALAAEPEHPAALYGAGAAAYLQGRNGDAISFLKRSLAIE